MATELEVVPALVERRQDLETRNFTYRSYSGADITAQIVVPNESAPLVLGDLQTLSYSIHRESRPVRLLGQVNPAGWCRGPRTVAGSLIFINFETYTFYRLQQYQALLHSSATTGKPALYPVADMLPAFDIIITFANEYGSLSRMKIGGVVIVDEGGTMSIEDLVSESQYTFMAQSIEPITYVPPQYIAEGSNIVVSSGGGPGMRVM